MSGAEWVPIGSTSSTAFRGTFDGQGHVIRNLTISGEGYENNGLFGYNSGSVKNTGLEDTSIIITRSTNANVEAICGTSGSSIDEYGGPN